MIKKVCSVCGLIHRTYEDGFEYLDCIRAYKKKDSDEKRRLEMIREGNDLEPKMRSFRE